MRPYYSDDLVTLYHADCLEHPELWTGADVLCTDPPYGIGWKRHKISRADLGEAKAGRFAKLTRNAWNDDGIYNDESPEVRDAALVLWGEKPGFVFGSLLGVAPSGVKQVAIYGKPGNAGNMTSYSGVRRDIEAIYLIGKHAVGGGGRSAIFQTGARRVSGGKPNEAGCGLVQKYGHPHAKPVDVLEELIGLLPGTIADPFAGSGSTLVAAKALGRKAVGVELEEKYCEIAANRCAQDVLPLWDLEVSA